MTILLVLRSHLECKILDLTARTITSGVLQEPICTCRTCVGYLKTDSCSYVYLYAKGGSWEVAGGRVQWGVIETGECD